MSDEEVNWQGPREPVRNPGDHPGYPSEEIREGIRKWGSPEDWRLWRKWEEFIRGETDEKPASLAGWLPDHELVARERRREAEAAERRKKARMKRRAEFVMREQMSALKDALGRGYIRSPLKFAHEGYPGEQARMGAVKPKGTWGRAAWKQNHLGYAEAWEKFMTGLSEKPPDRTGWRRPSGWAVELENKGYVGNDPPLGHDKWLQGTGK